VMIFQRMFCITFPGGGTIYVFASTTGG